MGNIKPSEKDRIGTASRHLLCFVPEDTAKGQILLHHDVTPHNDTYTETRGRAKNLLLAVRQQHVDMEAGDFKWCRMAPPIRQRSSTQQYY